MSGFSYSFGIEEEYFVCAEATGELVASMPPQLLPAARAELDAAVTSELHQSQIEVASRVFYDTEQARTAMLRSRLSLGDVARSMGLRLIAAGTHPLGAWHEQQMTEAPRYDQLMSDFRIVSHRNLVCGLHVHGAVPADVDRIDVMNRAMRWLPLFLALSTSSPFWNGRITGLLSYRQTLYDEWPRSGIPDFFADEADYDAFVDRMRSAGAIKDASQLWWAIRPALRYPTLELRIADACTILDDALAIASLFRCLIAALVDRPELGRDRSTHTRRIIDENRWRAKRDGIRASFIGDVEGRVGSAANWVDELCALVAEHVDRHGCVEALHPLRRIVEDGTSAHLQLRVYNDARAAGADASEAMQAVLEWLAAATLGRDQVRP
jgi:carboxylate-amine ligase